MVSYVASNFSNPLRPPFLKLVEESLLYYYICLIIIVCLLLYIVLEAPGWLEFFICNLSCLGPSTLARIQIEPEQGGKLKVTYMPLEVGVHSINLQFNGCEVEGCPFHPRVVDPCAVEVVDDFSRWTAPDRLCVTQDEMKTIRFDTSCAGPGYYFETFCFMPQFVL